MKRALYYGLIVVFAAVFLFSAWNLGNYYLESLENDSYYDSLSQRIEEAKNEPQPTVYYTRPVKPTIPESTEDVTVPDVTTAPVEEESPTILSEYAQLYLDNPDLVGWIEIEGTRINYPVMQTPGTEDYYLHRNFDGEYSKRGCIFLKATCDVFEPSDNIVIYGHNMRDDSMFGELDNYTRKSYWQEHRYITFNTLLEKHTYEIIAVFKTTTSVGQGFKYHQFVNAGSEEAFNEFVSTCKELSFYDTGVTAEYGDKLITLSTCEYTLTNGRLVVVAKRVS